MFYLSRKSRNIFSCVHLKKWPYCVSSDSDLQNSKTQNLVFGFITKICMRINPSKIPREHQKPDEMVHLILIHQTHHVELL